MQVTILQYIKEFKPVNSKGRVLTRQGILWRINKGIALDSVSKVELIGKQYVLTICK